MSAMCHILHEAIYFIATLLAGDDIATSGAFSSLGKEGLGFGLGQGRGKGGNSKSTGRSSETNFFVDTVDTSLEEVQLIQGDTKRAKLYCKIVKPRSSK